MLLDICVSILYTANMFTKDRPLKNRLAELRDAKDMTQSELGRAIGVNQHSISNFENGFHGISDANKARICTVLGCTLDQLYPPELLAEIT